MWHRKIFKLYFKIKIIIQWGFDMSVQYKRKLFRNCAGHFAMNMPKEIAIALVGENGGYVTTTIGAGNSMIVEPAEKNENQ
jgi:hypothetical protein